MLLPVRRALGVAVLLVCCGTEAAAHAVLTGSSLGDGYLSPATTSSVTLTFNSGIESGLSKVVLRGAGEDRTLALRAGVRASELVVALPPLAPGAYALHYKVLAVDGHVTESVLRFAVGGR